MVETGQPTRPLPIPQAVRNGVPAPVRVLRRLLPRVSPVKAVIAAGAAIAVIVAGVAVAAGLSHSRPPGGTPQPSAGRRAPLRAPCCRETSSS
jgi:hypothetical protein